MHISCNWLGRHVDLSGVDLRRLAERFTLSVAELEGVHEVGRGLDTVVVGRVREVHPIEGARVRRTVVDTGAHGVRQIVCGAANVAAGQLVPVALPGTVLGGKEITEAEVRGVASAGMICSEVELGLSGEGAGILVLDGDPAPGTPLPAVLEVVDTLFELDNKSITHRPDLWGHRGLAREVGALLGRPLKPAGHGPNRELNLPLSVAIEDLEGCRRYTAVVLDGVRVGPAPLWMRLLLHRVGMRPINNVVDATNFVMLDLGNPIHAFDRREVRGDRIVVRRAREGEKFTTLDQVERALHPADVVIADAERAVALGGVMGGLNSEIRDDTTSLVLEAACFDPSRVRMTSQRLGLRTEASARFEKSLDPHLASDASAAFCALLQQIAPGVRVASALHDAGSPLPEPPVIPLSVDRVNRALGTSLPAERVVDILERLAFGVTRRGDQLTVTVPTFRATKDIGIEADLIEEVGRSFGYDDIPPASPMVALSSPQRLHAKALEREVRAVLRGAAFDEVLTYSFDHEPTLVRLHAVPEARLEVKNPLNTEMPGLRTHLGSNLLRVLERNANTFPAMRFYELERVFRPTPRDADGLPWQPMTLGVLAAATLGPDEHDGRMFFGLKGVLRLVGETGNRGPLRLVQGGVGLPWVHPVRQARIVLDVGGAAVELGYLAEVHPLALHELGVPHAASIFELDVDRWRAAPALGARYVRLPRYPSVSRDFAVVVDERVPASAVRAALAGASDLVVDVDFLSLYRGKGVAEGRKCLAWSATLRHEERTLEERDIRGVEDAVWRAVAALGGERRA